MSRSTALSLSVTDWYWDKSGKPKLVPGSKYHFRLSDVFMVIEFADPNVVWQIVRLRSGGACYVSDPEDSDNSFKFDTCSFLVKRSDGENIKEAMG